MVKIGDSVQWKGIDLIVYAVNGTTISARSQDNLWNVHAGEGGVVIVAVKAPAASDDLPDEDDDWYDHGDTEQ